MEAAGLPADWRRTLWREAERHADKAHPLTLDGDWLANRCALLRRIGERNPLAIDATNDDVNALAHRMADECARLVFAGDDENGPRVLVQSRGLPWQGLERAQCVRWWRRQLNRRLDTHVEEAARALGHVGGHAAMYVSHQTHKRKMARRRINDAAIDRAELVEVETGELLSLRDAVDSSVACPALRRAELMTRVRGYEDIAEERGDVGLFITLNCATRFHPVRANGTRNELWHGESVRAAQLNQCQKWARVRARWEKHALRPYGLRVAEPHKSGTVHWHALMFVPADQVRRVLGHILRVWREDQRHTPGRTLEQRQRSRHARCKAVRIDASAGTAAGYVAKYVSKNIDGHGLEAADKSGARRVRSWASAHRIRQFQFFGGPTVGVWREARRIAPDQAVERAEAMARVIQAVNRRDAEKADYAAYVRAMGGIWVRRRDRPVQLMRVAQKERNAYGDEKPLRVVGVWSGMVAVATRERRWRPVWSGRSQAAEGGSRTRANNCNPPDFKNGLQTGPGSVVARASVGLKSSFECCSLREQIHECQGLLHSPTLSELF